MIRITDKSNGDGTATLHLEGRVTGQSVTEVRKSCESYLSHGIPLSVDISEVSFLDVDGLALLKELQRRQVRLMNGSPFVMELLQGGVR